MYPLRYERLLRQFGSWAAVKPWLSVKTAKPVPKDKIFEVMRLIRAKTVAPPVSAGDVIISGVFGTDIIATKSVE